MARTSAPPNKEILEAALQGLEAQKQRLDEQIAQVRSLIGRRVGRPPKAHESTTAAASNSRGGAGRKKRVLSAEARKRIAAAQKKRWASFRKTQA